MKKGMITGDRRGKVRWENDGEKLNPIEKIFTEKGCIEAYYGFDKFYIAGYYCDNCKKIIIDAKLK
ncbi:MAG: PF20097 family protein [Oscillospiraceae bacterium]|nr:PF20097 family protein [Oscillospiraceae bacterium]